MAKAEWKKCPACDGKQITSRLSGFWNTDCATCNGTGEVLDDSPAKVPATPANVVELDFTKK
jgi:DnaJ-class molecular chaperone